MTMERPFVCVVDENRVDRAAVAAILACAMDRPPAVEREGTGRTTERMTLSWVRLDSPKREASISISTFKDPGFLPGSSEERRRMVVEVLRRALSGDPDESLDDERLETIVRDGRALAAHMAHQDWQKGPESQTDHCHTTFGTPWSRGFVQRSGPKGTWTGLTLLDADGIDRMLPRTPDVVLVRSASINRRGRATMWMDGLNASSAFKEMDVIERMRLSARFGDAA